MEQQQLETTGLKSTKSWEEHTIEEVQDYIDSCYADYWAQVYATTQSEALRQKAALILGIKQENK